jgi:hypothetical protein
MTVVELFRQRPCGENEKLAIPFAAAAWTPDRAYDTVEAEMPAAFPSPLSTARPRPTGAA